MLVATYGLAVLGLAAIYIPSIVGCFWSIGWLLNDPYAHLFFIFVYDTPVLLSELPPLPLLLLRERLFHGCLALFMAFVTVITIIAAVDGIATVLDSSGLPRWRKVGKRLELPRSDGSIRLESPGTLQLRHTQIILTS